MSVDILVTPVVQVTVAITPVLDQSVTVTPVSEGTATVFTPPQPAVLAAITGTILSSG